MASARFWQPPGMPQVIWIACLPSVQVTIVASVSELGSGPGARLGSVQAAARAATPRTSTNRSVARETMFSPPFARGRPGRQEYLAASASYSVVDRTPSENMSMRAARAFLLLLLLAAPTVAHTHPTNEQLAARCTELGAIFDRYG